MWCQMISGISQVYLVSATCRPMEYFNAGSTLGEYTIVSSYCIYVEPCVHQAVIIGTIMDKMHGLDPASFEHRGKHLPKIRDDLDYWFFRLPTRLRLNETSHNTINPNALVLHMQYWTAVLLLHRNLCVTL